MIIREKHFFRKGVIIMKKFIILSIALGVLGINSLILKDLAADANLSQKDVQLVQVAKAPATYSPNIIWFIN